MAETSVLALRVVPALPIVRGLSDRFGPGAVENYEGHIRCVTRVTRVTGNS